MHKSLLDDIIIYFDTTVESNIRTEWVVIMDLVTQQFHHSSALVEWLSNILLKPLLISTFSWLTFFSKSNSSFSHISYNDKSKKLLPKYIDSINNSCFLAVFKFIFGLTIFVAAFSSWRFSGHGGWVPTAETINAILLIGPGYLLLSEKPFLDSLFRF